MTLDFTDIEESALDTAPVGLYRVCRDGVPVTQVGDLYVPARDAWVKNAHQTMVARVKRVEDEDRDMSWVPYRVVRSDGMALYKQFCEVPS